MEHINQHKNGQVHMIGIGGSSMSGLASILADKGYRITGSDIADSAIIQHLRDRGIPIYIGHTAENITGATVIVRTAAVHDDNPEIIAAREKGIPIIERSVLLGQLMTQYEVAIGIAGTHGKTTTTSMTSTIFELAGVNPTIHIGGVLDLIGGSTKSGDSRFFITEACEYVESFLTLRPNIAVILNIDNDHLDYYKNLDNIQKAFTRYAALVPAAGTLIVNYDDPRCMQVLETAVCRKDSISLESMDANWYAGNISFNENGFASFDVYHHGNLFGHFSIFVPGRHNVYNALAAIAISYRCGLTPKDMDRGFRAFHGADRRFDEAGVKNGMRIVHDYAHHPTEIRATIDAAVLQHPNRVITVFQPHTYSRLINLFDAFTSAFDASDITIVTDVYAARETNPGGMSPKDLVDALNAKGKQAVFISSFEDIASYLVKNGQENDLILTIGAGTIEKLSQIILDCEL